MTSGYLAGVDLGGTKIYTALARSDGEIIAEIKTPTPVADGVGAVIGRIAATISDVCRQGGITTRDLAGIGVGAPGPLNPHTGLVYQAPNLKWQNVPLQEELQKIIACPCRVENDANLAALGEYTFGAGQGADPLIYVTVSTGIGGGIILGGRIFQGATGQAGEIGHLTVEPEGPLCGCGARGCLEALASGTAIAREARILAEKGGARQIVALAGQPADITARHVGQAAATGDAEAVGLITRAGYYLGIGLAGLINLIDPQLVVIGGGAAQIGPALLDAARSEMNRRILAGEAKQVHIVPAALGERVGVYGAIALAIKTWQK